MRRGSGKRTALLLLCLFAIVLFTALGIWQVERWQWKLDLIDRVEARIQAAPVHVPPRSRWSTSNAREAEYRRVRVRGVFLHDRETLVDAVTERGPGFWVLTPLRTGDGVMLVNRGYVPPDRKAPAARLAEQPRGEVTIAGLLRPSEPEGRFLRPNRPAEGRWFSRDVAAIARARGLAGVAPFFVDANHNPNARGYPIGGMTIVRFRNAHLLYALTWFGLAALSILGLVLLPKPGQGQSPEG